LRAETKRIEFDLRALANLPLPNDGRAHYYDERTDGFGLRVESNGRKSFFWFRKPNGNPVFRHLGDFEDASSLASAKGEAQGLNKLFSRWKLDRYEGENPFTKKKTPRRTAVPTFEELIEAYIANHVRITANTPKTAEYMVRWRVKTHFADWLKRPLDSVDINDVLAVKNACGKRKHLANRAVELVRAVYSWAAKMPDGKINFWDCANPAKNVTSHEEVARKVFLQPEQVVRFEKELAKEKHGDLKDFLTLAMETGARKMDLLSMRWADVHPERRVWTVPFPKSGESYDVDLSEPAIAILKRREMERSEDGMFVFPGTGASKHLIELKKPWDEFRKRAQIPDIHIHDLRRTVGSYAAMAGKSLQQIGAMLGHRSMQSTLVYAHLNSEATREARDAGRGKMKQMMRAAKRRTRLGAGKTKLLTAASNG
jgi:integrase